MLSVILVLLSLLISAKAAVQLKKRSPPIDPADYFISANKYENSWYDKHHDPKKTFFQESKARDKFLMLKENNAEEISGQAWKHHYELNEIKEDIKKLVKKKDAANYKFDAYAKLSKTNYAQRASNLGPVAQAALYEAYTLHGLTGASARDYLKEFIKLGKLEPHMVQQRIKEQQASDPNRDKIIQQLQAAYLTTRKAEYFDLIKNNEKNLTLARERHSTLDRNDRNAMAKHQRDLEKVNLKESSINHVSWDAAKQLSDVYEASYWRHVEAIKKKIKRLKLMQAKQEKWTQAALEAGSFSFPPSPYQREDSAKPDVWEVEDEQAGTSEHCYE